MTKPETVVRLETWRGPDPRGGGATVDRFSLLLGDHTIIVRLTEAECRAYAREMGWRVVEGEG